ncbi:probable ATP-dependent DNA helicase HFM1 [Carassius auratus]|uniref:Probable ATP-dependent DNA helicase HFM1 n=1 Tax=Carassius auratus TaxID=7957 RepID=A0A6P6JRH9_CARAU|nr:probable ATP-dependent DNA helicase HFM1 [Carassius auratus]XP_026062308.1 probable ATP-dependent DNA helicase HFM1 [Carassius auratus]XP_026062309.1 probable ATP-dependent DNA helicase HFM1 [Carassius auratus]
MLDSEEGVSSVDNLFYDGPVIHKVKPLCQGQGSWTFDAPPSLSQIPATQDIQGEAAHLFSLSCSQRSKKFLPPAQKPIHNPIASVQWQTVKSHELEESVLWTHEPSRERHQAVDQMGFVEAGPSPTASAPPFKTRLFRAPTRRISGNDEDSIPNQMMSTTNDMGFLGQVAMTNIGPQTTHAVATCSPFTDFGQTEKTCETPSKTNHNVHFGFKPAELEGSSGKGALRPVSEIPAKFRSVFKEFPYFNYVQSQALDDVLYTNKNFVACAPTGSGKTVLFELAIVQLLIEASDDWHNVRAVYMAPIKALCSQRFENWKQKFGPLGLNCKELTGDTEIDDIFEIQDAHLIFTTPEKWDSMTRRWKDNRLSPSVSLFLIDEIHVVKDKTRGATLEVVVSRMKTMHSYQLAVNPKSKASTRFVAVSATIPNIQDVSEWLSDESGPATCLEMDETHRPVKLRKVVLGFPCGNNQNEFKFDLSLNYKMANVIQTYSDQKPTLVFCSTRKGVQQSASVLAKDARFIMSLDHKQRLMKYANSLLDAKLRDLFICGIGYHHAGMDVSDRKMTEEAFTVGDLPVLFTTSTLAMGVNLPAHLVVIKSTLHYVGGACEEYSEADLLQMIGRAGRPQFDTTATAVIMTRSQTKDKYTHFLSGIDSIESSLHTNLVEHLNAEIVLHTISDVNMALDWIRSTFLYIRALKNPKHYGFSPELDKCGIETKLQELCLKNLNSLASFNLITMDEDINIKPTEIGKLMARYCVAFDTVKQFSMVTGTETLPELIEMISKGKEFSDVQLRVNEKKTLNMLNKDKNRTTIRFPMEGKIKSNDMKVNCLIQAQLGCIPIQEFGLIQDTGRIFRNGNRVSRYLTEFLSHHSKSNFSARLNSLILAKCFRAKLWENSPYISRQLERIGLTLATAMVNAGLTTFSKIEQTSPRELEIIVNRHPPFGNQIKEAVSKLPKCEVTLEQIPRYSLSTAEISVTVNLMNFKELASKQKAPDHHYVTLIIGDCDNNVVFQQKILNTLLSKSGSWSKRIEVTRAPKGEELSIHLISSEYVGLDVQQKYSVYYSGVKRFGAESCITENPTWRVQRIYKMEKTQDTTLTAPAPSNRDPVALNIGKRQCHHLCKNKELCGHDCCKIGVIKRSASQSNFTSYLNNLKIRNERLCETPVKRLKMRMNNGTAAASMQQFSYKPKDTLPAAKRFEGSQRYTQSTYEIKDLEASFDAQHVNSSFESYHDGYNDKLGDIYSEIGDPALGHSQPLALPQRVLIHSQLKPCKDGNMNRISANQASVYTAHANPEHSADSDQLWSGSLDVTFDLGVNDWDDFDDGNLVEASEVCCDYKLYNPMTDHGQSSNAGGLASASQCTAQTIQGTASPVLPQRILPMASTSQIPVCSEMSMKSLSNQSQAKTPSVQRRFDFITWTDATLKENTPVSRDHTKDICNETSVFLGMFDGLF